MIYFAEEEQLFHHVINQKEELQTHLVMDDVLDVWIWWFSLFRVFFYQLMFAY